MDGSDEQGNGAAGVWGGLRGRLMAWFVGGPPRGSRTFHLVFLAIAVLLLVSQAYLVFGQSGGPLVTRLFTFAIVTGVALSSLGSLHYGRRRAAADLMRLAGNLVMCAGLFVLAPLSMWQSGQKGWFWYAVTVFAATAVVVVLYSLYKRSEAANRT